MDFETLGTAIAILSKADPVVALASGLLSGIFGTLIFGKAKNGAKKNREVLEKILILKGEKDARKNQQDTE